MGEHPVILFDGGCNLCDSAVQFIIRRDPQARFRFAAMQSPAAQRLLGRQRLSEVSDATMVLIEDGEKHCGAQNRPETSNGPILDQPFNPCPPLASR